MSERIVLAINLKPEMRLKYCDMHRNPNIHVVRLLEQAGHTHYKIHLFNDLLVASFDYTGKDLNADREWLRSQPELQSWMSETADCQTQIEPITSGSWWTTMEQVFPIGDAE
ncbi:MAG: L-rhamnose mutarotase [Cocleimonas sp.]